MHPDLSFLGVQDEAEGVWILALWLFLEGKGHCKIQTWSWF